MLLDDACGIDEQQLRGRVQICDVDHVISMVEGGLKCKCYNIFLVQFIVDKLEKTDRLYAKQHAACICENTAYQRPCWFKFAFAFLKNMYPVPVGAFDMYSRDFCPVNASLQIDAERANPYMMTREWVQHYGHQFARILRERWQTGDCGEDLLLLTVLRRPEPLFNKTLPNSPPAPFIFISYGSEVTKRLDEAAQSASRRGLRPHNFDPIATSLRRANHDLDRGHHLITVTDHLLDEIVDLLDASTHDETKRTSGKFWGHVPYWAVWAFLGCTLLCVAMMAGLCVMRSHVRRGSQRGKMQSADGRRWKTGFVGDDAGYSEQKPGVNLMQMMIPVGRSTNTATVI